MTVQNSNFQLYNDVLRDSREVERPQDVNCAEKVGPLEQGLVTSSGNDLLRDGGGRVSVVLKEESVLKALCEMEVQLGELTNRVGWLK